MRHYLLVNTNGEVIGPATHPGGFSGDLALSDPGCAHPLVANHYKSAQKAPGFDRFVMYECSCPDSDLDCQCVHARTSDTYADGHVLKPKPTLTVLIDDVPVAGQDPVPVSPGATVVLKLRSAAPDGHQITVRPCGLVSILLTETLLTFTDGETDGVTLTGPTHAMTGSVGGLSKYVPSFNVHLRASV